MIDGHPLRVGVGLLVATYLRRRCCFIGHSPEEVAAESEVGRYHLLPCRDDATEQIVGAPVPQITESIWDCAACAKGAQAES